jgi:hypothetical protein
MKLWADFHPYVLPDVFGCPEPMLDQALRETAREFCKRAKVWKKWSDSFLASGNQRLFEFDVLPGSEVVAAVRASVDGEDYSVLGSHALPAGWQDEANGGVKDCTLIHVNSKEFVLYPKPNAGESIVLELALRPTMTATGVGDVVFEEFTEAIAWGTKYRLWTKPNKPWTNPQSAAQAKVEFEGYVHSAANQAWRQSAEKRVTKTI